MARRNISMDEKIAQQKQAVFQAKDKYEAAVAELDKLMKKRDELRSKELLAAFAASKRSFDEVMQFLKEEKGVSDE